MTEYYVPDDDGYEYIEDDGSITLDDLAPEVVDALVVGTQVRDQQMYEELERLATSVDPDIDTELLVPFLDAADGDLAEAITRYQEFRGAYDMHHETSSPARSLDDDLSRATDALIDDLTANKPPVTH